MSGHGDKSDLKWFEPVAISGSNTTIGLFNIGRPLILIGYISLEENYERQSNFLVLGENYWEGLFTKNAQESVWQSKSNGFVY